MANVDSTQGAAQQARITKGRSGVEDPRCQAEGGEMVLQLQA